MTERVYVRELFYEQVQYRVIFRKQKNEVVSFTVQLEFKRGGKWQPVMRFDTAHGFAHCDKYRPDGKVDRHLPVPFHEFDKALTHAIRTVTKNWKTLCEPFRRAIRDEEE